MVHPTIEYLILPGWMGSGSDHWQSHWQACLPGASRLSVASWDLPQPEDWQAALSMHLRQLKGPVALIAHSLGCINLVNWAAQADASLLANIRAALLVAPADVERPDCPAALQPFAPIQRAPLPFPALVVGSTNDPAASEARVRDLAMSWQVPQVILSEVGHINAASGHHCWEDGWVWLDALLAQSREVA